MGDSAEPPLTTNPPIGGFISWPSAQGYAILRTHPGGSAPAHRYANLLIGDHLDKFRPWADFRQQTQRCKFASLRHAIAPGLTADHTEIMPIGKISLLVAHATDLR